MTKTDPLEPFGTIKACPACDASEKMWDISGMNTFPAKEFGRQHKQVSVEFEDLAGYIVSTCWRCGYTWHETALYMEENDED